MYSIGAPDPTIRSMKVPPAENGFLIEDVRFEPGSVRPINASEQRDLHGLDSALANVLMAKYGMAEADIGELAGSSIPSEMSHLQVGKLNARIYYAHQLEDLEACTEVPWQHINEPSVSVHYTRQVQLVVIRLDGVAAVLTNVTMQSLPGKCHTKQCQSETEVQCAQRWAMQLTGQGLHVFLAAEAAHRGCDRKLVVAACNDAPIAHSGCRWATLDQLDAVGSPVAPLLAVALARLASFQNGPHCLGDLHCEARHATVKRPKDATTEVGANDAIKWRTGKTPVRYISPETHGAVGTKGWVAAVNKLNKDQQMLVERIRQFEVDHPAVAWLQ